MLRVNGTENIDKAKLDAMGRDNLQTLIHICQDIDIIKELGDVVTLSDVDIEGLTYTFSLDNGKVLKRIYAYAIDGDLYIEIHEGIMVHKYRVENRKVYCIDKYYYKNDMIVKDLSENNSYLFHIMNDEDGSEILINFVGENFDKQTFINNTLDNMPTCEYLEKVLPKEDLIINFSNDDGQVIYTYKNNELISKVEGDIENGKEGQER